MDSDQIEEWLERYSKRSLALGGGSVSLVCWPGHWTVTTAGGDKSFRGNGDTAAKAFMAFESDLANAEDREKELAQTLGIT